MTTRVELLKEEFVSRIRLTSKNGIQLLSSSVCEALDGVLTKIESDNECRVVVVEAEGRASQKDDLAKSSYPKDGLVLSVEGSTHDPRSWSSPICLADCGTNIGVISSDISLTYSPSYVPSLHRNYPASTLLWTL